MFGRNLILAAALGLSCSCALPAQARSYDYHGGGHHYYHPHYDHYHPHYDSYLIPGYRYVVPDGYEGAPAGAIIIFGGYQYIAHGDGTMSLAQ